MAIASLAGACVQPSAPPSHGASRPPGTTGPTVATTPGPWQVLFDGAIVSGLRAYGADGFPTDRWVVEAGRLATVPGASTDLITEERFEDLELEFTWAVTSGGNSGVMIAVTESADPSWTSGPEYQVLDDAGHPDGQDPLTSAGALYGLLPADPRPNLQPVGQPNESRIVVRDGTVEHWLAGALVLTYQWDDPGLRATIAASKFAGWPAFMAERSGHLVFQHHGEAVWFEFIRVRHLD
jgi:hypothetical protein